MKRKLLLIVILFSACSKGNYSESTFFSKVYESSAYDLFGSNRLEFQPDSTYLFVKKDGSSTLTSKGKWNYNPKSGVILLETSFNDTALVKNNQQAVTTNYFIDVTGQEVQVINRKNLRLHGVKYLQKIE